MNKFLSSNLGRLRIIALLEGVSFIVLLFIAMPVKYLLQNPSLVKVVGGAHGVLFVIFAVLLLIVWLEKKWSFKNVFLVFLSSFIPFGTFYTDHKIMKPAHLAQKNPL